MNSEDCKPILANIAFKNIKKKFQLKPRKS